ncbi:GDP-mannose 4,6-dehydratase [Desulfosudis oleivorans]|uniref:GDP-mannose 4,6-dehydratase n=1 Tax=Desulfosudis oleivorans (strain DSM 6200 / JCM 39069 / Hxd3) TaxID=96561 RepID=A8ZT89_DESOH|nr:GDP-mannose 4,6-dehydratase [Desulfosudis oleivorans]ABW67772.1 NAD-dependent epimerase/dehydratase [Desulfosudis oleivorans Hxd3]
MKKALICGVSGQDGAYLAKLLVEKGYRVCGTSRDAQNATFSNLKKLDILNSIKTYSMALNDFRSVLHVLNDVEPDEVYNLSGQSSVGLSFEQPVESMESISLGTLNMLEAIRFLSKKIRFYNAGSSECFGETTVDKPADEATPFHPQSPYAVAKSAAHWQVATYREAYGLFACTGILFNHESCLRPERFVTRKIIESARRISMGSKETLVLGNIKVVRDWGWAPEYVDAMWRILQMDSPADFVIATGHSTSLEHFVELVFAAFNLDWEKHVETRPELLRPLDLVQSHANPACAMKKLGWQAKNKVEEVVRLMVNETL